MAVQYGGVVLCRHWTYPLYFQMVDYAIAYVFWIGIVVVFLKVIKDSINPK